jgi:hypothetical protein
MADIVTSICVLVTAKEGEFLYLALPKDGQLVVIPVRPAGKTPKTREPEWSYVEEDGKLYLTPSLYIQDHNFHTAAQWVVLYERFIPTEALSAYEKFEELNPIRH